MSYKADFHVHSFYSDGLMKPTDLVKLYKEKEYDILALTDHDGVDGVREALIAGEALDMKIVPGIELSTSYSFDGKQIELHILGYYIDIDNLELKERLEEIRETRRQRNEALLAYLNQEGYPLTWEDLMKRPGGYIGRPDFARALEKKGWEIQDMWSLLSAVERKKIDTTDAINLIKQAGGIAVLAHPMKIKGPFETGSDPFWDFLGKMLYNLKREGLKGLECYHPSANEDDAWKLIGFAEKYHLHITEGSDFHGDK